MNGLNSSRYKGRSPANYIQKKYRRFRPRHEYDHVDAGEQPALQYSQRSYRHAAWVFPREHIISSNHRAVQGETLPSAKTSIPLSPSPSVRSSSGDIHICGACVWAPTPLCGQKKKKDLSRGRLRAKHRGNALNYRRRCRRHRHRQSLTEPRYSVPSLRRSLRVPIR